ncbi:MAG TPA: hypothetical protein VHG92_06870 [Afifellaceae bacterium]|nr:hypothetical protein [Afifellaceae bacterium]
MFIRVLTATIMILAAGTAADAQGWSRIAPSYQPPPVPHCADVIARHGDRGIWVGDYTGRYNTHSLGTAPYGARGCFQSEAECRRWLHQNMSFAGSPMMVMSCRPL